jgi:hypothetical protein
VRTWLKRQSPSDQGSLGKDNRTDNDGKYYEMSAAVTGSGGGGGINTAPVVSVGGDQSITLPATANLDDTVIDDGRPNATPTTA